MDGTSITFSFFIIFTGAAVLASAALFTRQPLLVAYVILGALVGPYGFGLITDTETVSEVSHIGIIFLLFLLGLDMQPSHLIHMIKKATIVAVASSAIFLGLGFYVAYLAGFTLTEAWVIGAALMFSSTIIGIKLLPTTVLHHRHTGELVVGLLLLQDVVAIIVLLVLYNVSGSGQETDIMQYLKPLIAFPVLLAVAFFGVKWVIIKLIAKFDRYHEYIFLLAIGWCLGLAEAAALAGLSAEIGAFVGGVSLATSPIAQYIAISLKPLRDFFLIMFFFSVGASFNLGLIPEIIWPSLALTAIVLLVKPTVFRGLLMLIKEDKKTSWEVGFRLGQISEFSILIAYIAAGASMIGTVASHVIQATAILTFLLSTYVVILNYSSPIAISDKLRRD
ncbi:MAG: cation:proton antiporter [Pontibacterium sp.]